MKSSVGRLHQSMQEALDFLRFAGEIDKFRSTAKALPESISIYLASASWRRQTYAFSIVGIYGAHERFIRDLAEETAGTLGAIYDTYEQLPDKIRLTHERLSLELAKEILDNKQRDQADYHQNLSNLHACLGGAMSLNREVFSSSNSNFRSQTVRDVMARLGISLTDPNQDQELSEIISLSLNGFYGSITSVIDDLADRRNQVAHGADFEILDINLMLSVHHAVYSYDCWLYRCVAAHLLRDGVRRRAQELGTVRKTYADPVSQERSIVSLADISARLRPGDALHIFRGSDDSVTPCLIRSIERSGNRIDLAEPGGGPYGLALTCPAYDNSILFRLPQRDASLATMLAVAMKERPKPASAARSLRVALSAGDQAGEGETSLGKPTSDVGLAVRNALGVVAGADIEADERGDDA